MKKWPFWISMFVISLINGAAFYISSEIEMSHVLNEAATRGTLIFMGVFQCMAIYVLIILNVFTLLCGLKIERNQKIIIGDIFKLSGLSVREKTFRVLFITTVCLLMLFGYTLLAAEKILAVVYALSGGALLLFLYAWAKASCP